MAQDTRLSIGTVLEEKSTGRELEITEVTGCTVAAYGSFMYKVNPSNPPLVYSSEIGGSPMHKFKILR